MYKNYIISLRKSKDLYKNELLKCWNNKEKWTNCKILKFNNPNFTSIYSTYRTSIYSIYNHPYIIDIKIDLYNADKCIIKVIPI